MTGENDHIINFKAEDFERYHSGKMSASEMHAIEKAALDDPFLADALEGYLNTQTPVDDMRDLKNELNKKAANQKVVLINRKKSFIFLKIAAILVVLAGFSWVFYQQRPVKKSGIAASRNKEALPETATPTDNIPPADAVKEEKSQKVPAENTPGNELATVDKYKSGKDDNETSWKVDKNKRPDVLKDVGSEKAQASVNSPVLTEQGNRTLDNKLDGKVEGLNVRQEHIITGRVLDDAGKEVAFATVKDQKNNTTLSTDESGSFSLKTPDSLALVAVNAIGYETKNVSLNANGASNMIVLQEADKNLSEVVVTSSGSVRKKEIQRSASTIPVSFSRVSVENAEPVVGWTDFNKYVNDRFKMRHTMDSIAGRGAVILTFNVNDSGRPFDLKIKKSLCITCDAEALRIIEQGPLWKQKKKRKSAEATIRF